MNPCFQRHLEILDFNEIWQFENRFFDRSVLNGIFFFSVAGSTKKKCGNKSLDLNQTTMKWTPIDTSMADMNTGTEATNI